MKPDQGDPRDAVPMLHGVAQLPLPGDIFRRISGTSSRDPKRDYKEIRHDQDVLADGAGEMTADQDIRRDIVPKAYDQDVRVDGALALHV